MRHSVALCLVLLSVFLLLAHEHSVAGSSASNYNDYYYNNASVRQLRFHNFEPRLKEDREERGEREARGFHFSASGEDVSVEMEFIVPFVKVPAKRSMQLARDAVQGLLNLRTGALLNTAVIVAAGAIIAGIVRLVLAPLVFTSINNAQGYGYSGKQYEEQPTDSNTISRGMRSLTQVLESQLDEHSIDVSSCAQRAICHYLQHNAAQSQRLNLSPSNAARLIDVLANSRWLDSYLNGTAVFSAIDAARSSRNCDQIYSSCSWPQLSRSPSFRFNVVQNFLNWFLKTKRFRTSAQLELMSRLRNSQQAAAEIGAAAQCKLSQPRGNEAASGKFAGGTGPLGGSMQLLYLTVASLILAGGVGSKEESEQSKQSQHVSSGSTTAAEHKQQKNNPGIRLISFDSVDKDIALGLNYLMPFVEVPVQRKRNAPPKPLVIVNSAAIVSCSLVAAGGILVGHLIRSLGLETIVEDVKSEDSAKHTARSLIDEEQSFLQLFDNFKLIYRNSSGDRVETALPSLMSTIERTFLENDINLPVCLLKSICALTHKAGEKVRNGQASDLELMLDGATSWTWLLSWLEQSPLREAIQAGRIASPHYCHIKYPRCKWTAPEEQLLDLLHNNVQFK
ncbi:uncharacterized protein LOC135438490 [Drosophila montana]|uniref:uncharacterized protein LOC135438490 n=1 Tax=Drosophila montana TaxID=40370 RepID=UPI00313BE4F5